MAEDSEMGTAISPDTDPLVDLEFYRRLVKQFIEMRRYQTAHFWAEKVCVLSQNCPKDVYCQAHCMFLLKEYHRAAHVIKYHGLEKTHIPSYNLLLESLYEAKELNEAIAIINNSEIDCLVSSMMMQSMDGEAFSSMGSGDESKNEILASICYMKGKIYEAMDNRGMAMDFYVQALHRSVFCYEALEALVQHEMLMAWEEKELMRHLPLSQQSNDADAKLIRRLYESKLKKYYESLTESSSLDESPLDNLSSLKSVKEINDKIQKNISSDTYISKPGISKLMTPTHSQIMSPAHRVLENIKNSPFSLHISLTRASSIFESDRSTLETTTHNRSKEPVGEHVLPLSLCLKRIEKSNDIMAAEAERLFYECEHKGCCKILNELFKIDPYHNAALTVQIGCLAEFGDYNKLFYIAHKLVDRYPDKAISWYAVGCYYDLIGKSDPARRYLSKATSLDRLYGPAWLAYGHSFAKENEHDQAMAAYFKATKLMRGCHLPLLYIGVECGLTKNLELAEKFFHQAMSIAPLDVFVLHELGVIKYEYEYYESAEEAFRATVEIITKRARENKEEISSRWEPLFNNLGHCCRKTKKYSEALKHHQFALLLKPQSASTYTAIGFIHALMGNLDDAIINFHKSLAINRDCIVTSTILKICIEDLMDEDSIIDQMCGQAPKNYATPSKSFSSKSKRLSPIAESAKPIKYNCVELKFDEEDTPSHSDTSVLMDMSMES